MYIKVRGINNRLVLVFDDQVDFDQIYNEFVGLLQSPLLNNGDYVKAFFDFKSRILTNQQMEDMFKLVLDQQVLLVDGVKMKEEKKLDTIDVINTTIRNGQVLKLHKDTLINGHINPGAIVEFNCKIYIMGRVSGSLVGQGKQAMVSGQCFKGANIIINDVQLQNYTNLALTTLYYKDNEIVKDMGDMIYV